jgi:hypothetical protein
MATNVAVEHAANRAPTVRRAAVPVLVVPAAPAA